MLTNGGPEPCLFLFMPTGVVVFWTAVMSQRPGDVTVQKVKGEERGMAEVNCNALWGCLLHLLKPFSTEMLSPTPPLPLLEGWLGGGFPKETIQKSLCVYYVYYVTAFCDVFVHFRLR